MLLFSLALIGQSVPLDTDTSKAAHQCLRALISSIAVDDPGRRRGMAQIAYFSMTESAAGPGLLLEDMHHIVTGISREAPAPMPSLAACDARFPLARTQAPAKLPAEPFDRDYLCYGVTVLTGEAGRDDADARADIAKQQARFGPRAMRINAARHLNDEASQMRLLDNVLRASLQLGNLDTLFQACARLPD
ncbi:hypothetical protein P6144_03310 [Sphingomonas sp. HITSZ_GF]|uniref:hypothetical protein n=1 Tax=Sphingomonas sp. HITSZ_GF TaxID=3037247 RepID=UPI00240D89C9|nr:hypothetical protein [Sphingomonas sp. HITSZ_GF]MDG2532662.1 hypothetical protein [Sphingomonas sp. HITSZ_GF]